MDEKTLNAYNAINNFIVSLFKVFPNNKSLAFYNRLLEKTTLRDVMPIRKHVAAFDNFLTLHKNKLLEENLKFQSHDVINYSDKVKLELGYFTKHCDDDTLIAIKDHLLAIYGILHPDDDTIINALENDLKHNSKEGKFVNDILSDLKNSLGDKEEHDPTSVITSLMTSGVLSKMVSGIQEGARDGTMDFSKLLTATKDAMAELTGEVSSDSTVPSQNSDFENIMKNMDISKMFQSNNTMSSSEEDTAPDLENMMKNMDISKMFQNMSSSDSSETNFDPSMLMGMVSQMLNK